MLLPLFEEEKERIRRLAQDKSTLMALKKMFINAASERPASNDTQFLAAQSIAMAKLYDIFRDIETIQPKPHAARDDKNVL